LSQSAVRNEKFAAALRLPLPELSAGISARAKDSPRDCVSILLSKTQSRQFRSAVSAQIDEEVVAMLVLKHRTK